ncbi:MAG: hypothetical protein H0W65_10720 [Sphingomonas sp.]|uniref:Gldg family protein n=1 Tax=Sphingomonas sp. TaxID=28214 RepID=UPI00184796B5|nr:hypothetical protein [Sphingomonas sp.]MBA3668176.1 hypothetical protein [Sphingomonas sp.]
MTFRSWPAVVASLFVAAVAWAMLAPQAPLTIRRPAERPTLALLTSLPLVFGESFSLSSGGSPVLTRLEQRYNVLPIGVADAASLSGQRLLLMAHPRAQPAEALVDLDRWVRRGGRVLLLADPRLDWDSARPFGDRLRPPLGFADTGLLAHWGLRLEGPAAVGPARAGNGSIEVASVSPGRLSGRGCAIVGDGFVARCRIGKGAATIIADADFLNVGAVEGGPGRNLDLLLSELKGLEKR